MIKVSLQNGIIKEYPPGITIKEILKTLGGKLLKEAIAARLNGKIVDLSAELNEDATLSFITFDDPEGQDIYRHSASHLLAQAVKRLYPKARLGIGPAIKDGFYYDIELDEPLSSDDFLKIEEEMKKII
ncbi:MAG: TGS domain-containing protein, partial [Firmicutes bacterium]|nr:TGS domain-containing protein [Bacillota bacterium]